MWFRYRALDHNGTLHVRERLAENVEQLQALLVHQGLTPLDIRPCRLKHCALSRTQAQIFFEQLAQLVEAGMPLHDACEELARSLEDPVLQQLGTQLAEQMAGGAALSRALQQPPWSLPATQIALIQAGELSGQLVEMLWAISRQHQRENEQLGQLRQQLLYPLFSAITLCAAAAFLLLYLVPQLLPFLQGLGHSLPWHTRALIWTSQTLQHSWLPMTAATSLGILLWRALYQRHTGLRTQWQRMLLSLPVAGPLLTQLSTARMCSTFGQMYAAGIPVHQALGMLPDIAGNAWLRLAVQRSAERVRQGMPLAEAFALESVFPRALIRGLRLGTQSGHLDRTLGQIARQQDAAAQRALAQLQRLCEPMLTLCMGALLCWILVALIGPIYDVIGQIKP